MAHARTDGPYFFRRGSASFSKPSSTKQKLRFDREGRPRTAYSLRHTYIYLRLMEGADIYQIVKNCRTSVEMIEKYYAAHIKTSLDAAAINVMRPKKNKKGKKAIQNTQASPHPPDEETDV
jgi:integrase